MFVYLQSVSKLSFSRALSLSRSLSPLLSQLSLCFPEYNCYDLAERFTFLMIRSFADADTSTTTSCTTDMRHLLLFYGDVVQSHQGHIGVGSIW